MYLKRLELAGFKSFGTKSVLEFSSPITSIVGPNGSGKSNIAESFRFVLGEQSIKSMRGKKGEDLIFNGGGDGGRANRASVRVTFDNTSRFLPLDMDEVVLERSVFRDGNNEYKINDSAVRLKDILELLTSAHIGSSGHHIISQGEADRILNSTPKERKYIIEEALGLKGYQYKKTEAEKRLAKTEENIKEIELSRREIAPHIRFLKRQVEKIEHTMQVRIELGHLYNEYLKRESVYLEHESKEIEHSLSIPLSQKIELEHQLEGAEQVLRESKKQDEKSSQLVDIGRALSTVENSKAGLVRDVGRVEGEIASLVRILEAEQKKQQQDETKMVRLSDVRALHADMKDIHAQAGAEQNVDTLRTYIGDMIARISRFIESQKNIDESSDIDAYTKTIAELDTTKANIEQKLSALVLEENKLKAEYEAIKNAIEAEKDSNRDAEKAVFKIRAELNHIETILSEIYARKRIWEKDTESFENEVREAVVLVGEKISHFRSTRIRTDDDTILTEVDIYAENRDIQFERKRYLEKLKIRVEDAGVGNSEEILKEYEDVTERDQFLMRELEDMETTKTKLYGLVADLELRIETEFKAGITKINEAFERFFSVMFGGGTAGLSVVKQERRKRQTDEESLDIEESEAETEEGVEITVSLPRKKIKSLMMLSGGERALTSIALLFAMSRVNPPPFIILDETDAALDEANSRKYGDMISDLSAYSQLILITHNRETMSRAGVLYGITMGSSGVSKLLSIAFDEAVKVAK